MPVAIPLAVATVAGAGISAVAQSSAAKKASKAQVRASEQASQVQKETSDAAIEEQRRQFDAVQKLLAPFAQSGQGALDYQQKLLGLQGNQAQQGIIDQIKNSSQFNELNRQGQNAILQNASATGGLRGGNVQAALSQFSPQLLQSLIDKQYANLGGLTSLGQNAAALTGNAGMQTGQSISNIYSQLGANQAANYNQAGAAQAGNYLAQGNAVNSFVNNAVGAYGLYGALKYGKF